MALIELAFARRYRNSVSFRALDCVVACQVESWSQLRQLLTLGVSARAEADTPENSKSSRGHAILTLEVRRAGGRTKTGNFVLSFLRGTCNLSLVVYMSNRTYVKKPTFDVCTYSNHVISVFEVLQNNTRIYHVCRPSRGSALQHSPGRDPACTEIEIQRSFRWGSLNVSHFRNIQMVRCMYSQDGLDSWALSECG